MGNIILPNSELSVTRCEPEAWELFKRHHYIEEGFNPSAKCFIFYSDNVQVGFCAVINTPRRNMSNAMAIHRIVVNPEVQGQGIGTTICNFIGGIFKNGGYELYIKCLNPSLGEHFNNHPECWRATIYNCKPRKRSNEDNKRYKNRNNGKTSYCHHYIGEPISGCEDLLVKIEEFRKMKSKTNNDMRKIVDKIKVRENRAILLKTINKQHSIAPVENDGKKVLAPRATVDAEYVGMIASSEEQGSQNKTFYCPTANEVMREAMKEKIPNELFYNMFYEKDLCCLFAATNLGKSVLAMDIADQLSYKNYKVLYLDFELSKIQFGIRYSESGLPYTFSPNFYRPDLTIDKMRSYEERLDGLFSNMKTTIEEYGVNVIIVDNLTYILDNAQNAKQATQLIKALHDFKNEHGVSILIISHTIKRDNRKPIIQDEMVGSKMIGNFIDSCFAIGCDINNRKRLYIKHLKCRNSEVIYGEDNVLLCQIEKIDRFLRFSTSEETCDEKSLLKSVSCVATNRNTMKAQAYAMKKEGLTNQEIANALGVKSEGTVRNWLKDYVSTEEDTTIVKSPTIWYKTA